MKLFNLKTFRKLVLPAVAALTGGVIVSSCLDVWSEQHPGTYYVNSGNTLATFLEDHPSGEFSDFVYILKQAGIWGEMKSYGEHTCFAPTNDAVREYLAERKQELLDNGNTDTLQFSNVYNLPQIIIDSIAKTHLCAATFYCADMSGDGAFPYPNMLDRYLTYKSYADTIWTEEGDTFKVKLAYRVNQQSKIIEDDDSVQNGVVHIIDKVLRPSNKFLPGLLKENPNATLFYAALMATNLNDSLEAFQDNTYTPVSYDSTLTCFQHTGKSITYVTSVETDNGVFPEQRQFKFTMFVVPDSVLSEMGITNLDELRSYAEGIYPEGIGLHDTVRQSSLNKFLSYHILPIKLTWDQLNTSQDDLIKRRKYLDELDVEDFYETMLQHSVMRISTPYAKATTTDPKTDRIGIFINRKGTQKLVDDGKIAELVPGVEIFEIDKLMQHPSGVTADALNGYYYYVTKPLLYDNATRNALSVRMRIMASTLSPDFINSGARGRLRVTDKDRYTTGFKRGYCKNFEMSEQTEFWVRYRDASFGTVYGDEITVQKAYDFNFRLPSVPKDGTYEIRIWNNCNSRANDRGVAFFYFRGKGEDWSPCGIPVDLRLGGDNPLIGWFDISQSGMTEDMILQNDKSMRNLGYMRAPDMYGDLHTSKDCARKIVTTRYMKADGDYYLRLRQILEKGVCPFSFIEIVPKDIYAGDTPEDRH